MTPLEAFQGAYMEAIGFTDCGSDDECHELEWSYEMRQQITDDCKAFFETNSHLFTDENCKYEGCSPVEYAGHDFWLTRCGHGAGFWDGDWCEPAATILDDTSKAFRPLDVYRGDDGLAYMM